LRSIEKGRNWQSTFNTELKMDRVGDIALFLQVL